MLNLRTLADLLRSYPLLVLIAALFSLGLKAYIALGDMFGIRVHSFIDLFGTFLRILIVAAIQLILMRRFGLLVFQV